MPIERLAAAVFAAAIVCGVVMIGGIAFPDPLDKAAHFVVFSLLTLCLWRATELPMLAIGAALLLGGLDEWRQTFIPGRFSDAKDFLADACAVLATATLLFMQRKTTVCAESSPQ
ncbi:MAG TPA: VanZ family protein [Burkholderiales bacterium]|nr:VanZ family protein [Burkholderiales bacterium]